jgi:hypothetical protein
MGSSKFYKSPWFWAAVVILLSCCCLSCFGGISYYNSISTTCTTRDDGITECKTYKNGVLQSITHNGVIQPLSSIVANAQTARGATTGATTKPGFFTKIFGNSNRSSTSTRRESGSTCRNINGVEECTYYENNECKKTQNGVPVPC